MTSIYTALNLEREPFSTSPDPLFFYRSQGHYTVLNRLEIMIRLKRGLSVVLGDVGTGKTTLLRALLQSFSGDEDDYIFHIILDPSFTSQQQFLFHMTKLFGVSPFFRSAIDYRDAIEKYLFRKCEEEKKTVVLLIDEGQKLSDKNLEILRTLLNYETNDYKLLQLVILGQMELLPRLKQVKNFADRINFKGVIPPLNARETGQMIDFRLRQAGYKEERNLFTQEAVNKIYQYTQGHPRQIARVCQAAMEYLITENYEAVTDQLIDGIFAQEKLWV